MTRTSTATGNWSATTTWNNLSAPGDGYGGDPLDIAAISAGHTVTLTASTGLDKVTFSAGAGTTDRGINGGGFTVTMNGTGTTRNWATAGGIIKLSDVTLINNAAQTINFNSANSRTLELNNGAELRIAAGVLNVGLNASKLIDATSGAGTLTIGPDAGAGSLRIQSGTATLTVADDVTFTMKAAGTLDLQQGTISVQSSAATLVGTVAFSTANTHNFQYTGTGTVTVGASLTSSESAGSGTFDIRGGTLSFNGTTSLALGKALEVRGGTIAGTANVAGGSGGISITSATSTVNTSPAGAGTVGTLGLTGVDLTWSGAASTLTIDVNSTGANTGDQIIGDAVALGAGLITLNISNGGGTYDFGPANKITLIQGTSVSGSFANWNTGPANSQVIGGQEFYLDITGTTVDLVPVPEPQHYAAAVGLGMIGFAAFRRSRAQRKS